MAQQILDDAQFEANLATQKANGTLDVFTAREVYNVMKVINALPCTNQKECVVANPTNYTVKHLYASGAGGVGIAGIIFAVIQLVLLHWK
jgi:hypothetical protein